MALRDEAAHLQTVFPPNGPAPFTPLASVAKPLDNTIAASITQAGFIFIDQRELPAELFADGFEASPRQLEPQGAERQQRSQPHRRDRFRGGALRRAPGRRPAQALQAIRPPRPDTPPGSGRCR